MTAREIIDEAKEVLGAASEPPVKTVGFGKNKEIKLGDETVLYRQEKTFVNQNLLAVNIHDDEDSDSIMKTLDAIKD